jgi:hypothetical protein
MLFWLNIVLKIILWPSLRGSQIQDIHYLENKANNKAVTLTYL